MLGALSSHLERADALDAPYAAAMDAYVRLRSVRAEAMSRLGWSNAEQPLRPFADLPHDDSPHR